MLFGIGSGLLYFYFTNFGKSVAVFEQPAHSYYDPFSPYHYDFTSESPQVEAQTSSENRFISVLQYFVRSNYVYILLGFVVLSALGLGLGYYVDQREVMAGEQADVEKVVAGSACGSNESKFQGEDVLEQVDSKTNGESEASSAPSAEPPKSGLSWMAKAGIVIGVFGASLLTTLALRLTMQVLTPTLTYLLSSERAELGFFLTAVIFGQVIFGFLLAVIYSIVDNIKNSMGRLRSKASVTFVKFITVILHILFVLIGILSTPFLLFVVAFKGVISAFEVFKRSLFDQWSEIYKFELRDESVVREETKEY
jgi:hypothetical protein